MSVQDIEQIHELSQGLQIVRSSHADFWMKVFNYQQVYEDYSFVNLILFGLSNQIVFFLWKPAVEKRHVTPTNLRLKACYNLFRNKTASCILGKNG